jgi:hypothetical protein
MTVIALEYRERPKAIKTARQDHKCWKCGATIKRGDKFAMCLDYGTLRSYPTCLKCYTEYKPEDYR